MPAKIKICGISTPEALDATIAARADYAGLVFYPASPRAVTSNVAGALTSRAAGQIAMVGLFVDADDAVIADALVAAKLNALQLHGSESPERVAQLRARFGKPVWKALPVASASDVARAAAYAGAADLILFDAKTPKGALPGGMGLAFDWSLLAGYRGALPWGAGRRAKSDECCRGDCAHRSAAGRYLQRRRKRAGRQGYRQDYQFRLCGALGLNRVDQ